MTNTRTYKERSLHTIISDAYDYIELNGIDSFNLRDFAESIDTKATVITRKIKVRELFVEVFILYIKKCKDREERPSYKRIREFFKVL